MVGARLAPGGFCRARAAAGHIGDVGSLICALLQPQSLSQAVHRAADTWEPHPLSPLVGSVAEVSLRAAVTEVSPQLQKPRLQSSCECRCPAMTDTSVLPTQVAKPPHMLNSGQGEGLLRPHPA